MTFVVNTKNSSEKPAMVIEKASRNLLMSVALFMIAPPAEPAGMSDGLRFTDYFFHLYVNVRHAFFKIFLPPDG